LDSLDKLDSIQVISILGKNSKWIGLWIGYGDQPRWFGERTFSEDTFWPTQNFILRAFENEGILFDDIFCRPFFSEDNAPQAQNWNVDEVYDSLAYDLVNSFV
jgi:imidazoleglycerol-phosphate dehydratase/histidinol-phosphatase